MPNPKTYVTPLSKSVWNDDVPIGDAKIGGNFQAERRSSFVGSMIHHTDE